MKANAAKLTCAFGSRWPCGPCRKCQQFADEACAEFDRDVFFGKYDRDGYTPAERRAKERKAATA